MAFLLLFFMMCIIMLYQIHHCEINKMPNFNVNDVVADITNIHEWRNPKHFKSEVFFHAFFKRVLATDENHFIIKSVYNAPDWQMFLPDDVIFSQSTGLDESKTRVLFNLTPHLSGIGLVFHANLDAAGFSRSHRNRSQLYDSIEDIIKYDKSMKDAFLTYFDRLHEEIAA